MGKRLQLRYTFAGISTSATNRLLGKHPPISERVLRA
jgi:hypothetical protein